MEEVFKSENGQFWVNITAVVLAIVVHSVVMVAFIFSTFATKQEVLRVENVLRNESAIQLRAIREDLQEIKEGIREIEKRERNR